MKLIKDGFWQRLILGFILYFLSMPISLYLGASDVATGSIAMWCYFVVITAPFGYKKAIAKTDN